MTTARNAVDAILDAAFEQRIAELHDASQRFAGAQQYLDDRRTVLNIAAQGVADLLYFAPGDQSREIANVRRGQLVADHVGAALDAAWFDEQMTLSVRIDDQIEHFTVQRPQEVTDETVD
jgi:hypothetical protein